MVGIILQESVSKRMKGVRGWRKLLAAAHFQLRPGDGEIPPSIFFPPPGTEDMLQVSLVKKLCFRKLGIVWSMSLGHKSCGCMVRNTLYFQSNF